MALTLIGVISKDDQRAVVEEFFELFKTPWEFYRPNRAYDVVITTCDVNTREIDAKVLFAYGCKLPALDESLGIGATVHNSGFLDHGGVAVPIYGEAAVLEHGGPGVPWITGPAGITGIRLTEDEQVIIRLGYDLFDQVSCLLTDGQPIEFAEIPTLDLHIAMLRSWIVGEGSALLEVLPVPSDYRLTVCLTHDIDFIGIRDHRFDHTMWGYLYRSTLVALARALRGRLSVKKLLLIWRSVAKLPFVYLGWADDFWVPFPWYLRVEAGVPATYFIIPFKRQAGQRVPGGHASRRAAAYDIGDIPEWTATLTKQGCELGVHGIDAWHDAAKGRAELERIKATSNASSVGIRMHWLLRDQSTFRVLEHAGFVYDSTVGYNEAVGFRSGTMQVYRPLTAQSLLELPLHIQDGALFFPQRLDLSDAEAWSRCERLIAAAERHHGVLTVLWHDRSHGPERFWGDFYIRLVAALKASNAWFGTAAQVVRWFGQRRQIRFELIEALDHQRRWRVSYSGPRIDPPVRIRVHAAVNSEGAAGKPAADFVDIDWDGISDIAPLLAPVNGATQNTPAALRNQIAFRRTAT